eukprot:TRINITY_DN21993_c0_g2_i1.p1 TRINITY_DN21993_c0_g2~~TRINITY_DN21993_c0_g2_i1.p1  ORF type:complete len:124 (-),score=2.85 TRINITY_DN21993_c0_g2_i1:28-399(-)
MFERGSIKRIVNKVIPFMLDGILRVPGKQVDEIITLFVVHESNVDLESALDPPEGVPKNRQRRPKQCWLTTQLQFLQFASDLPEIFLEKNLLFERSEEHTSELQSHSYLVCRLLLEKKKKNQI